MWKKIGLFALGLGLGGITVAAALIHHGRQRSETVARPAEGAPEAQPQPSWLEERPSVAYTAPARVPEAIHQKYPSFEKVWSSDEAIRVAEATGVDEVNHVDEGSPMMTGLRPGDRIISVNGQPIGSRTDADRELQEQLRRERRVVVLVEHDGQHRVLTFNAGE